ncbi:hypothetical protein Jiend_15000 [Micromonospora endophytica]|nr:hypothetical protein Jiend_15000 [Micromonospora endophytica]
MVGVPEKTPPDDNAIPGGNDPDRTDNRYGAVPPEAAKVCVGYGWWAVTGEAGDPEVMATPSTAIAGRAPARSSTVSTETIVIGRSVFIAHIQDRSGARAPCFTRE